MPDPACYIIRSLSPTPKCLRDPRTERKENSIRLPWLTPKRCVCSLRERFSMPYLILPGDNLQTGRSHHPGRKDARKRDKLPPWSGLVQDAQGQPGHRLLPRRREERDKRVCRLLSAQLDAHNRHLRTKDLGGEESLVLGHIKATGNEGMSFASFDPAPRAQSR